MNSKEFTEAAIQIALRRMYISSPDKVDKNKCFQRSGGPKGLFILCNSEGKKIASIDNDSIQKQLSGEGEVPSIASIKAANPPIQNESKSSSYSKFVGQPTEEEIRKGATDWATSMGYPVPTKWNGCLTGLLIGVGVCAYVVPGVVLCLMVWNNGRQYERDMKALVEKWIDAGKPEPGIKARPVEQLEKIEAKPAASSSTENRLEELGSMKEKGLISQEEYDTLRKKALGL